MIHRPHDSLPLFDARPESSKPTEFAGVADALFDAANPGVYATFARLAFRKIAEGERRWSADKIMQDMRWELRVKDGDETYQINNVHRAYLSRRFMRENPQHEGFFEVRERKGAA